MAAPSLEPLAERFAPRGIQFLFIYVREAHPGEHYPHHTSSEQKLRRECDVLEYRFDLAVVGPDRLVGDPAVAVDDVDHVRERTVLAMDRTVEIIDQQDRLGMVLLAALARIP